MPINKNELSKEMIVKAMQCETAKKRRIHNQGKENGLPIWQ